MQNSSPAKSPNANRSEEVSQDKAPKEAVARSSFKSTDYSQILTDIILVPSLALAIHLLLFISMNDSEVPSEQQGRTPNTLSVWRSVRDRLLSFLSLHFAWWLLGAAIFFISGPWQGQLLHKKFEIWEKTAEKQEAIEERKAKRISDTKMSEMERTSDIEMFKEERLKRYKESRDARASELRGDETKREIKATFTLFRRSHRLERYSPGKYILSALSLGILMIQCRASIICYRSLFCTRHSSQETRYTQSR